MREQKKKISFTVACVNEFARRHNIGIQESFRYLFRFKGIDFIKENYEVEHTLDFETIVEDLGILCRKNGGILCNLFLVDQWRMKIGRYCSDSMKTK